MTGVQRAVAAVPLVLVPALGVVQGGFSPDAWVWAGALARTQYPKEVTKAPDGCRIIVDKVDGTTYDFWHAGRSGTTHSPEKGTLLDDLVTVVETLTRYADAPAASQPALVRQLDAELGSLQLRIERGEPCLRPRPHRHDAKKR